MPDTTPTPEPAPSAPSAPALPPGVAILASSAMSLPQWKARKFRDNTSLALGGSVDVIADKDGKLAVFVADPAKLTPATLAEIAQILAEPRYAKFINPKS